MKFTLKFPKSLAPLRLCAFASMVFAAACTCRAQVTPFTFLAPTNLPATVAATSSSNQTSIITLQKGMGLGLAFNFALSANATSNTTVGYYLYPSPDGTNFATTGWAILQNGNGTNILTLVTNWSPATLAGLSAFSIGTVTNQNGGTLTNRSTIISRPN